MNPETGPDFLLCFSRTFLWRLVIIAAAVLLMFYAGRVVLVLFAGVLLAVILRSATRCLERLPFISQRWSYTTLVVIFLAVLAVLSYALGPRITTQVHEILKTLPDSVANARAYLAHYEWGRYIDRFAEHAIQEHRLASVAGNYAGVAMDGLTNLVLVFASAAFLAADPRTYTYTVLMLLHGENRETGAKLLNDMEAVLRGWLFGQMIPMAVLGLGTLIGLWILHVPLAFTLALFTALMLFVPYVGSVMAYLPTVLIALAQGPMHALYVTILYLCVHIGEGYIVTPLSQRHAIRLPPVLSLTSQFIMWKLAGLLGVLVATPLAAVAIVAVERLYLHRDPKSLRRTE